MTPTELSPPASPLVHRQSWAIILLHHFSPDPPSVRPQCWAGSREEDMFWNGYLLDRAEGQWAGDDTHPIIAPRLSLVQAGDRETTGQAPLCISLCVCLSVSVSVCALTDVPSLHAAGVIVHSGSARLRYAQPDPQGLHVKKTS